MTIADTLQSFAITARLKADLLEHNLPGFMVSAMMAGAYVGMGILLIFSVGQGVDASAQPIVMGASFGIALTLVIFAGSELFTGHTMYMMQGRLMGSVSTSELCKTWVGSWLGNLLGAAGLGMIFVVGSSELVLGGDGKSLLHAVAAKKMNAPSFELVARAILCNWLVCLAIWMSSRTKSDTAKCVLIFWCLYAFIAAGFEHSVANMTVFSVALLSQHSGAISVLGAMHNLIWVTLGNVIGGAIFMGAAYWLVAGRPLFQNNQAQAHTRKTTNPSNMEQGALD